MNGIEKIAARLQADAAAEISAIKAECEADCAAIDADYAARAEAIYAKAMEKGTKDVELRAQRLSAAADMESRKAILAFKQEMVSEAFARAIDKLRALPDGEYVEYMASLAASASSNGMEELIFAEAERRRGEAVCKRANAILREKAIDARLTLSADSADIPGGFIMKHGDIEANCAADTLVMLWRDKLASQVAGLLFN